MTKLDINPTRWLRCLVAALGVTLALAAFTPTTFAQSSRGASAQAVTASGVVNIQTATPEQLELLPGIGPSKASAIVAYRERRSFRRVEDIMRVRGIGRSTFRRLRSMLTIEGPTTLSPPARRAAQ